MTEVQKEIEINASPPTVYLEWMKFEEFPNFMEGVKEVRHKGMTLHWKVEILGQEEEWDAEILQAIPYSRIIWKSINGIPNAGAVFLQALPAYRTRLSLSLHYEPQNAVQSIGQALGVVSGRVQHNLECFRERVEKGRRPQKIPA